MRIVFNNAVGYAMTSFWDARYLRSLEMMAAEPEEVPVLAMILAGGRGPVAADREADLDTGHGGVIV